MLPFTESLKRQDFIQVASGDNPVVSYRVTLGSLYEWIQRGAQNPAVAGQMSETNTKAEIMAWMDKENIQYNASDTKADLLVKAGLK